MLPVLVLTFILNLVMCFVIAGMGSRRRIGFNGAFLLSFFFSFIIGLLFVLASERVHDLPQVPQVRLCCDNAIFIQNKHKEVLAYYHGRDYKSALAATQEILEVNPYHSFALISAAKIHALLKNKKDSYRFIQRAYESEYSFFAKDLEHSDFDFIRSHPEFREFELNGYGFPKSTGSATPLKGITEEIKKLKELKGSGILTEDEFQAQKHRILNR